ncbi:AGE family epimerase/isomerase [Geodermatophilus sabuli]|uniref:Mannose or cellobiose epimerase, N-acyl-D-glucosamine 2-epimerase family n=1 Tax=Geodermatophilus sabuli TaxID=1564158 RepID=A0A285E8B9_9ACTN|nr:AGE family epimerase/isomerase [Geodermatophilus sabuli]MBB3085223.1 mannose/cellobiose epimerase-like protein (N-acyl-D-glucosamine 2-epimerase family) [Geodermatophilus sabuli]SNX95369.1 Mannose or cellobiose epimerase, N-acyl-D-glucosamine 2-epimerase family [Geodermatophilus sabuli]
MTDLQRLLDFAERSAVPGGFGFLGGNGQVIAERPLMTFITARKTHVFGLAQLLGRPGAGELVRHGVEALTDGPLRDAARGGWYATAEDDTKSAYVHAFVVLAGATATVVGAPGGRELLDDALDVWQTRFWDDDAGLAVEEWDAGWTRLSDYRGANANMHGVEASLAAADALGDGDPRAARLRTQALRSTERVVHGWARERAWRLPEHFTPDWTPLPEYNRDEPADPFRPYGVTIGHQFEWARLALHLRAVTPEPPAWLIDDGVALFDAAATRGWAADGADGFPYTLGWDDRVVVGARMHWVLCEAVAAAEAFAGVTGDRRYGDLARRWRAHGEERFADPVTGSWHHELTPDGRVASGTWDGQPDAYHLVQMLLLSEGRPVRGSVAATLR